MSDAERDNLDPADESQDDGDDGDTRASAANSPSEASAAAPTDPSSHVEDVAEVSPEDVRVRKLLDHTIDVPVLAEAVERQEAADAADTLEALTEEEAAEVLQQMDDQSAAEALSEMRPPLAVSVIEQEIEEDLAYASRLLELMAPDDAADLLQRLDDSYREEALAAMPLQTAARLRRLVSYDPESAAGLMTTDYLALDEPLTVNQAIDVVRGRTLPKGVHHLLVTDERGRVVGAIGLRDLLVAQPEQPISQVMNSTVKAVRPDVDREHVAREFDRYDYSMLPVVDLDDRLIGLVTVDDVIDIIRAEQTEDVQKTVGAGAVEAVYSPIGEKLKGRLPWLGISLCLTFVAASVILFFEEVVRQRPVLVFLLPAIAAVVGNAGQQALMVTLRGIVLEEVRPERVIPLLIRETWVGALNGAALGIALFAGIWMLGFWVPSAGWEVGAVAGVTMTLSMMIGTLAGSGIPLIMRRLGFDPAQSASIFLIMLTDALAFSFLLTLSLLILKSAGP